MPVKIGHASIDESGKVKGGVAGDQTGKELCTRNWYNKNWKYVLRCNDTNKSEIMAQTCEKGCANSNIGYDQNQRNTLNTQAKLVNYDLSKITTPCETDCSAFMSVCAQSAGVNIPYHSGNAPTTSSMLADFISTGLFSYFDDDKHTKSDKYLRRGDILVSPGHHTVMVLTNGNANDDSYPTLKRGSRGYYVEFLQTKLQKYGYKIVADGVFGVNTFNAVVAFQGEKNLTKDGIVGSKTWASLGV